MMLKKAIFPVAGMGTRFLPITKSTPKEMLPIVDKPLIQYAVEEAISAGISELIFITSSSKQAIEDHFDSNFELETRLIEKNKLDLVKQIRNICPDNVSYTYVRQSEPLGLGHAVYCARHLINNEPVAILLADDLIDSTQPCLQHMADIYQQTQHSVIAVTEIDPKETSKYGIIKPDNQQSLKIAGNYTAINDIIEKPQPAQAPSNYAVVGRYILTGKIFQYLEDSTFGSGGEIQLTDAIAKLIQAEQVLACHLKGERYDCGSKLGYLKAMVNYALKHPTLATDFATFLQEELILDDITI